MRRNRPHQALTRGRPERPTPPCPNPTPRRKATRHPPAHVPVTACPTRPPPRRPASAEPGTSSCCAPRWQRWRPSSSSPSSGTADNADDRFLNATRPGTIPGVTARSRRQHGAAIRTAVFGVGPSAPELVAAGVGAAGSPRADVLAGHPDSPPPVAGPARGTRARSGWCPATGYQALRDPPVARRLLSAVSPSSRWGRPAEPPPLPRAGLRRGQPERRLAPRLGEGGGQDQEICVPLAEAGAPQAALGEIEGNGQVWFAEGVADARQCQGFEPLA